MMDRIRFRLFQSNWPFCTLRICKVVRGTDGVELGRRNSIGEVDST